jgi:hypothetical protein
MHLQSTSSSAQQTNIAIIGMHNLADAMMREMRVCACVRSP